MQFAALSSIHLQSAPNKAEEVGYLLQKLISNLENADQSVTCYQSKCRRDSDMWVIHCYWKTPALFCTSSDDEVWRTLNESLMDLVESCLVRSISFSSYTSDEKSSLKFAA